MQFKDKFKRCKTCLEIIHYEGFKSIWWAEIYARARPIQVSDQSSSRSWLCTVAATTCLYGHPVNLRRGDTVLSSETPPAQQWWITAFPADRMLQPWPMRTHSAPLSGKRASWAASGPYGNLRGYLCLIPNLRIWPQHGNHPDPAGDFTQQRPEEAVMLASNKHEACYGDCFKLQVGLVSKSKNSGN